jgi:hypothetical protein
MVEPMRRSREEFENLATKFKKDGPRPPQTALYAFASLLADDELVESIAESFTTAQPRTVWVLIGITDASLIRVRASSACDGWSWQEPGTEEQRRGELLEESTLWPLSALRSLEVARVRDTTARGDHSRYEWEADWVVTLRDAKRISLLPSQKVPNRAEQERIESLIAVIRQHI